MRTKGLAILVSLLYCERDRWIAINMLMLALARDLVYDDHWGVVAFCPFGPSGYHSSVEVIVIIVQLSVPRREVLGLHDYAVCHSFSYLCAFFSFWKNIYALVGCTYTQYIACDVLRLLDIEACT